MPSDERNWLELASIGVGLVFLLAYSTLVIQRPLAGLGFVIPLVVLYLLWRLVRAAERIADAVEDDGPGAGRSTEEDSSGDDSWTGNDAGATD
jgi:hypothetical protein